ncbi:MAG: tetraacyldisaccharide 4'-kinase, partial [Bacteroidota bacterium]|nr:tetraacyldisaccharide 4'-kinase [Bacteroidota bacterium]
DRPYYTDFFLPTGRLRDSKSEVHRANIIVITKCPNNIRPIEKSIWAQNIKLRPYQELFFTTINYNNIINVFNSSDEKTEESFKNFHILIFSGIANQYYFTNHVKEKISKNISILKFKDHKNYLLEDVEEIIQNFEKINNKNKIILTTEKDAVKIRNMTIDKKYKKYFYYQEIKPEFLFKDESKFNKLIENTLD